MPLLCVYDNDSNTTSKTDSAVTTWSTVLCPSLFCEFDTGLPISLSAVTLQGLLNRVQQVRVSERFRQKF